MWENELKIAIEAGLKAREAILKIYHGGFDVEIKEDDSPVTIADKTADKIISAYIKERFPTHALLTEESNDDKSRLEKEFVWIVDPVDGTKDFVAKDDEFTTNIALSQNHDLVVGVVVIPVSGEIYYATRGNGAFYLAPGKEPVRIHVNDKLNNLTVFTSVFHLNDKEIALIEKHSDRIARSQKLGSSIKACHIADGQGEVSFRMSGNTKEWDTAAIQIIVEEAGGIFLEPDGTRMKYNRDDVYNRNGYIICNRKENFFNN